VDYGVRLKKKGLAVVEGWGGEEEDEEAGASSGFGKK